MTKNRKLIFYLFLLFVALFISFSFYHAYMFTHPTYSSISSPKSMEIQLFDKIKVMVTGVRPIKNTNHEFPQDYPFRYENASFYSADNIKIDGWLIKVNKAKGTIVLGHGWYSDKVGMLEYSKFLNNAGYSTLLFDFRSFGDSEGTYTTLGYYEKNDILGAVSYLKARKDIDKEKIGYLGLSMGAAALVMTKEESNVFNAIVLDSTYPSLYQNVGNRFNHVYGLPKFPFATSLVYFGSLIDNFPGFDLKPVDYIGEVYSPILLIQGRDDTQVHVEEAENIYKNANEPKKLIIIEGAGHIGSHQTNQKQYEKEVLNFFDKYLTK